MPAAAALLITPDDLAELRRWARSAQLPAVLVQRARILLLAAEGVANTQIAQRVGVSRPTVIACRRRYVRRGLEGLPDRPRPGRPQMVRRLRRVEILAVTVNPPPARLGITHWSTRLLAGELGVSRDSIARIWREYGVQPWRAQTFKFSTDPELAAKVHDVVGLYLHPPKRAVVLCVDDKAQIQALERTQPVAPRLARAARAALPRLSPPWHHHPVRRAGGRDRARHQPMRCPSPPPGVPRVPQTDRLQLPTPAAAPGLRQLRHPQAPHGPRLARQPPPHPAALHSNRGCPDRRGSSVAARGCQAAASSLLGVTVAIVASSAARSAGRCR
jgi:transposase